MRQDGQRFMTPQYHKGNLIEEADRFRPLTAAEREELHGLPPGYTDNLELPRHSSVEDARCSAVANGWHIPSAKLALCLLLQAGDHACADSKMDHDIGSHAAESQHGMHHVNPQRVLGSLQWNAIRLVQTTSVSLHKRCPWCRYRQYPEPHFGLKTAVRHRRTECLRTV